MRTHNENTRKILSLSQWPEKPLHQQNYRLSPISAKIITVSGFSVHQLLPASVSDCSSMQALDTQHFEDLIYKYLAFDRERMQKVEKLRKQREQYEKSREMIIDQESQLQISATSGPKHANYQQNRQQKQTYILQTQNGIRLNVPIFGKYENSSTSLELKASVHPEGFQVFQNQCAIENIEQQALQKRILCPRLTFSNKNEEQSPSTTKKARANEYIALIDEHLKNKFFMNRKSVKWQPELTKAYDNYGSTKLHHIKSAENLKPRIKNTQNRQKKREKEKASKSKSKKNMLLKNSVSHGKKSRLKKSTSKSSRDSMLGSNLNNSKNASDGLKTERLHFTQNPQCPAPKDQYYNLTATRVASKKKKTEKASIFLNPMFDQLSKAADQLLNLAHKQQIQTQMLENLHSIEQISARQRKRLQKIHSIQRDQLKSHIHELKNKIGSMNRNKLTEINSTL